MPDPDAPNDPESVRYRCSVNLEEDDVHENSSALELKGTAARGDAMQAFQLKDPNLQGTRLTAPDPMALVRDQLAALQPAASAEVPSSSGARGAGEL